MSGVQTGTRLQRLEQLAAQIQQEIRHERIRLALEDPNWKPLPKHTGNPAGDRCHELGVTTKQVKEWAVRQGLLPAVVQGRLALPIVEAYATRHRLQP